MAFFSSPQAARLRLLKLPLYVRVNTYETAFARPFSASATRQTTLTEIVTAGPSALIDGIHSLGIPWYASLPLTAVLVRSTLVYYFSTLPSRRAASIQAQLVPLASARSLLEMSFYRPNRRKVNRMSLRALRLERTVKLWFVRTGTMFHLGRVFGAPWFHPRGLVNFGVLLAFTEAVRMKCGSRQGLLSLVLSPFEWVGGKVAPASFPAPPPVSPVPPEELLALKMEKARESLQQAGLSDADAGRALADAVKSQPPLPTDISSAQVDLTLQQEGLSWCMDLTLPDPTFILPIALSTTLALSTLLRPTISHQAPTTSPSGSAPDDTTPNVRGKLVGSAGNLFPTLSFTQRLGLSISLIFFFGALKMPAAILLYFIPSIAVGWLQSRWLDLRFPIHQAIRPCARPMRLKGRKEWQDL